MHCSEKKPLLSGSGQPRRLSNLGMSASTRLRTYRCNAANRRFGPCVDGSELARTFFTSAVLVGAAMCSA